MDRNMKKWHSYKLSDVVRFNPSERLLKGEIAKKVPMDLLQPYTRGISGFEMASYTGGSKFRNGDTLMARITPCLENGKTAYVSMLDEDEVGFGSTEYIVFRNIEGITDNKFVYYFVTSPWFRDIAVKSMVGSSGRQRVQQAMLENLVVNLPPLAEQKQIAGILGALDDKIELNRCINDNLEQQAQALFKSWFVDFEPFKDGEFVDSELGMIPKGWRVVCLGEVTKQVTEKVGNREDVTVLSPVNSGELVLSEEYFTKQVFSKNLSKYLIVNPLSFAYNPARINIGSIGLNEYDFVGCVSPVYVVFKCEPNYHYFFDFYKRTAVFKDEVALRAIGGVRQSLGYDDFSLIKTIYPTPDVVAEFNNLYLKMKEVITRNDIQNNKLTTLRDSLLPKLMSGELKINNFNR